MQLHVYSKTANNVGPCLMGEKRYVHYLDGPWTPSITTRSTLALTAISDASAIKQTYQCQHIVTRQNLIPIRQHPQWLSTGSSQVCHRGLGLSLIMEVKETATTIRSLKSQLIRMFGSDEYVNDSLYD
jgi:hypothetical protein